MWTYSPFKPQTSPITFQLPLIYLLGWEGTRKWQQELSKMPWIWEASDMPGMKSHSPVLYPSRWASPRRSSCSQTPASRSLQWCWAKGAGWQWRQQVACGSNKRIRLVKKKKNQSTFIQRNITPGRLWGGNLSHLTRLYKSHILLLVIASQWMNAS